MMCCCSDRRCCAMCERRMISKHDQAIDYIAREVIAGVYGNGSYRKDFLYFTIQSRVNEIMRGRQA